MEYAIAFFWGLAEATFFFFIPDIYLTRLAIINPSKAFKACFVAAIAACFGGSLMYIWALMNSYQAYYFLTLIPAIFPKLIEAVNSNVLANPFYALFIAPFKGIPYKIYAVAMGANRLNFTTFIVTSFFSRLFRFLLITSIGTIILSKLKRYIKQKLIIYIHITIWCLVYILYFCSEIYFYF